MRYASIPTKQGESLWLPILLDSRTMDTIEALRILVSIDEVGSLRGAADHPVYPAKLKRSQPAAAPTGKCIPM
jgi:hypothetical protein